MAGDGAGRLWVTHPPCNKTWAIADFPLDIAEMAKKCKAAKCPACGDHKGIMMARKADIAAALA